jgi:hypothetical protein
MTTLTPEQRQEIERAGDAPVLLEDPETRQRYVLLKAEVYESLSEADSVRAMYPLIDRTFREGWETVEMAEYDEYEKHRP